jgi:hypothetical protein
MKKGPSAASFAFAKPLWRSKGGISPKGELIQPQNEGKQIKRNNIKEKNYD